MQYFKGDELAARVWVNKYAVKDSFGNIYEKSPEDMHWRIANEVARIEAKYPNALSAQELFDLLDHFKYIVPQGSPMTGIGNDYQVASLSNCFVIGLEGAADSYGAIIRIDEEQVQLMKRRGGVGHDLSHIRPSTAACMNSSSSFTETLAPVTLPSVILASMNASESGCLMDTLSIRAPRRPSCATSRVELE